VYYGEDEDQFDAYRKSCRWAIQNKGAKIQNFYQTIYEQRLELFNASEYIFILDDDIFFDRGVQDINFMFEVARKYSLKLSMPAFHPNVSRISWKITAADYTPNLLLRYTSIVEWNAAMVEREAMRRTMEMYHGDIIGWGSPHLAICANGEGNQTAYAVVHAVKAINPPGRAQNGGTRELSLIKSYKNRSAVWDGIAREKNCTSQVRRFNYKSVYADESGR